MATEMQKIVSRETAKQTTPEEATRQRQFVRVSLVGLLAMSILVAIILALTLGRAITARLNTLMDNASKLSRKEPLNPPLTGTDEVAELDHVFRVMAAKLADASRKERAVIDNAVDVICSIDAQDRFSAVNPAALNLWGYNPERLIARNFLDLVLPEDQERTKKAFKEIMARTTGSFENRIKRSDGGVADMRWSVQWSDSEKSLFCVVHDVTDRKQMERMKQEFVAMVSHDLRSPLSSIKMTLELLAKGTYEGLSEKGQARVDSAFSSTRRLIKLVSDILDIEKMESGRMEMHKEITLTSILIDRSIEAIRSVADERGVSFEKPEDDFELLVDGDRLTQVLVNLLSNAVKFSDNDAKVEIGAHKDDEWIVLTVTDYGKGIPADKHALIFERYKQVDKSDSKEKGGTGLGLAICKAIVEAHAGTIGVSSEEGSGSTFWIRLPA